ncbi:hypothetical protein EV182_005317 [Spiromyces aspiralis]|uniref:Uncharacterized protein n=1 Tax=Spiromyces aspiralis TaxID=68401 RepID=A0ACC1HR71_9FUNG|nr:hypothetical protein EV182_005317 [Spiromyces aspiralis]
MQSFTLELLSSEVNLTNANTIPKPQTMSPSAPSINSLALPAQKYVATTPSKPATKKVAGSASSLPSSNTSSTIVASRHRPGGRPTLSYHQAHSDRAAARHAVTSVGIPNSNGDSMEIEDDDDDDEFDDALVQLSNEIGTVATSNTTSATLPTGRAPGSSQTAAAAGGDDDSQFDELARLLKDETNSASVATNYDEATASSAATDSGRNDANPNVETFDINMDTFDDSDDEFVEPSSSALPLRASQQPSATPLQQISASCQSTTDSFFSPTKSDSDPSPSNDTFSGLNNWNGILLSPEHSSTTTAASAAAIAARTPATKSQRQRQPPQAAPSMAYGQDTIGDEEDDDDELGDLANVLNKELANQ